LNFHYKWALGGVACKNLVQLMEVGRNLQNAWTECQNNKMAPIQLLVAEPALANQPRPERFSQYDNAMRSRQEERQTFSSPQARRDVKFSEHNSRPSSGGSIPANSRRNSPGQSRSRSPAGARFGHQQGQEPTQQPTPADRKPGCCDSCGKAGHYAKFCPDRWQKVANEAARVAQHALMAAKQALLKVAQGNPKN